jgi:molybdopterin-containing oxidoreductase family membrane subunit
MKATLLALVTLLMGFVCIGTELERPILLIAMAITSPNPASPIWWMGALYGLVTVVIALDLYFQLIGEHHKARTVGIVAVVAEVAANSNLGAVFGMNHARPVWYGPFVPVYFIVTALVSGAALLLLVTYLADFFATGALRDEHAALVESLRKLLALFLGLLAFFTAWRVLAGVQGGHYHKAEATQAFLTGPLFTSFWFFEVFLMMVVPLAILLGPWRRAPSYLAAAGALPVASMFVTRFNFVYSGQMFSLKPVVGRLGETMIYQPPFKGNTAGFLPYTPSVVEALIVLGALAGAVLLYAVGTQALRLREEA